MSDWEQTTGDDATPWAVVSEAEGIEVDPTQELGLGSLRVAGSIEVSSAEIWDARTGPLADNNTVLRAAEDKFHATGGLVGDWARRNGGDWS